MPANNLDTLDCSTSEQPLLHVAGAKEQQACYEHARGLQGGVEAQLGSVQMAAASGQVLVGAPLAAAHRWANWLFLGHEPALNFEQPAIQCHDWATAVNAIGRTCGIDI